MPIEYAGRGDPIQTLLLLWRKSSGPSRGPKRRLTVDQIVAAAIELADADGLDGLTMRGVADTLGVGAMTLYRYVPGKSELIDLMLDAVSGEEQRADMSGWSWRQKLEFIARQAWDFYHRHPWVLQVSSATRPVLGPETLKRFEAALSVLSVYGLPYPQLEMTLTSIDSYVRGLAREAIEVAQAERVTGVPDEKWWSERNWFWEQIFNPDDYPTLTRYYTSGEMAGQPISYEDRFEFGLQRLLDGFDRFIERAPHPAGDAAPPAEPYSCD
jgi:AcrR family transcriptional regulator